MLVCVTYDTLTRRLAARDRCVGGVGANARWHALTCEHARRRAKRTHEEYQCDECGAVPLAPQSPAALAAAVDADELSSMLNVDNVERIVADDEHPQQLLATWLLFALRKHSQLRTCDQQWITNGACYR